MKFLLSILALGLASPVLAALRLQEMNRIGLTGKINEKLVAIGRGALEAPISSELLVREDSILLGVDEGRRLAGRLAVVPDYSTMLTAPVAMSGSYTGARDKIKELRAQIAWMQQSDGNTAALSTVFDLLGRLDRIAYPHRLKSGLISKNAYEVYERDNGTLYLLVVNVVNDYLTAPNRLENLLLAFDHTMTEGEDVTDFIKQEALQRRGVYLAVAEIERDGVVKVQQVGVQFDDNFWSSVYGLVVDSDGTVKSLGDVESTFAFEAAAGNNFMTLRRHAVELRDGDSLFLITGVNDFESSELMLYGPRFSDKHVADTIAKFSYYLGDDHYGLIDIDDIRDLAYLGRDGAGEFMSENDFLNKISALNYTLLYYSTAP